MPVNKLSNLAISSTSGKQYSSMLAGYGDFGALQRIAYYTSSSNFGNYTFSNIPSTFQDLKIIIYARDTTSGAGATGVYCGFNGDFAGTTNSYTSLIGNGSTASSNRATNQATSVIGTMPTANASANIFGALTIDILNYANTSTFKTTISRSDADLNGSGETRLTVSLWRSTAAINSIIFGSSVNFTAGTTMALYGVRASAS